MGRLRLAVLAFATVAVAASAPAGTPGQARTGLQVSGGVLGLGGDGGTVAVAVSGRCPRILVWTPEVGRAVRFRTPRRCARERLVAGPTLAGTRALWVTRRGREWKLWTASHAARQPRLLRSSRERVVLGEGDASRYGELLPYAVGETVVVLRENGSRRFRWKAPTRITAVAAKDGEVAVALATGIVVLFDASGNVLREERFPAEPVFAAPVAKVFITGNGLVVQQRRFLELRRGAGHSHRVLRPNERLVDADGGWILLLRGESLYVGRVAFYSEHCFARIFASSAQLEGERIYFAWRARVRVLTLAGYFAAVARSCRR